MEQRQRLKLMEKVDLANGIWKLRKEGMAMGKKPCGSAIGIYNPSPTRSRVGGVIYGGRVVVNGDEKRPSHHAMA